MHPGAPRPDCDLTRLSPRQVECLTRIAAGETSGEIARALGISRQTVDEYVGDLCRKLGAKRRSQAVAMAISLQLIPPSRRE